VAVVATGWLVREVVRRRGGVGLEPMAVPASVPAPVPASVPAPVLAPASAEDEGSLPAGIGAFLPLGYP
jgi:hypothetical protein